MFDKVNGSRVLYLHREIHTLTQGTMTISDYFSKLRDLWDELNALMPCPGCPYPELKKYAQHFEQHRLLQFLMGLNESYSQSRSQIMMMYPIPSINKAYSLLVDQESQRSSANFSQTVQVSETMESTSLYSNRTSVNSGGNFKQRRNQVQCEYCHYKGHTKENCYKLIGYPADFKPKKKGGTLGLYANHASADVHRQGEGPQMQAGVQHAGQHGRGDNFVVSQPVIMPQYPMISMMPQSATYSQPAPPVPYLTQQQYQQIVQLLNKSAEEGSSSKAAAASTLIALLSKYLNHNWIVDTSASKDMIFNLQMLNKYQALPKHQRAQFNYQQEM